MEAIEQENLRLREEVATLQSTVDKLTTLMGTLLNTQNQTPLPHLPSQALQVLFLKLITSMRAFIPMFLVFGSLL
jgi:hypothetical protein